MLKRGMKLFLVLSLVVIISLTLISAPPCSSPQIGGTCAAACIGDTSLSTDSNAKCDVDGEVCCVPNPTCASLSGICQATCDVATDITLTTGDANCNFVTAGQVCCASKPEETCTDTDSTNNKFVIGSAVNSTNTYEDTCAYSTVVDGNQVIIPITALTPIVLMGVADKYVIQHSCAADNSIVSENIKCNVGCFSGVCLPEPNMVSYGENSYSLDYDNKIMWTKDSNLNQNFNDANIYCGALSLYGYGDWRLPTQSQVISILTAGAAEKININLQSTDNLLYWTNITGTAINRSGSANVITGNARTLCVRDAVTPGGMESCQICRDLDGNWWRQDRNNNWDYKSYSNPTNCVGFDDTPLLTNFDCAGSWSSGSPWRCWLAGSKRAYNSDRLLLGVNCGDLEVADTCEICTRYARAGKTQFVYPEDSTGIEGYIYTTQPSNLPRLFKVYDSVAKTYYYLAAASTPQGYGSVEIIGYVYPSTPTPTLTGSDGLPVEVKPIYDWYSSSLKKHIYTTNDPLPSAVLSSNTFAKQTEVIAYVVSTPIANTVPLYNVYINKVDNPYNNLTITGSEAVNALGWNCAGFNGEDINTVFNQAGDGDMNSIVGAQSIFDVKVNCQKPEIQTGCRLCMRNSNIVNRNSPDSWNCVNFNGTILNSNFPATIARDSRGSPIYGLDFKIDCNVYVPPTCTESDFGEDIYTAGSCTGDDGILNSDTCTDDGSSLIEWTCGNDLTCGSTTVTCPDGCLGGKCLPRQINNDVYVAFSAQGDFDKTLDELVGENDLTNVNLRQNKFKIVVDERMLSALNSGIAPQSSCTGTAKTCSTFGSSGACYTQSGCSWYIPQDMVNGRCTGVTTCSGKTQNACPGVAGCSWTIPSGEILNAFGYYPNGVSYNFDSDSAVINKINPHPYESDSLNSAFEANKISSDSFDSAAINDFASIANTNNLYLFRDENLDNYYVSGKFVTSSRKDTISYSSSDVSVEPGFAAWPAAVAPNYTNGAYVYIDLQGKLHIKYKTQNQNSRTIFALGIVACECTTSGEEGCDGTFSKACDGCSWVSQGEVMGKCGIIPTCTETDSGLDYFNAGSVSLETDDTPTLDSCSADGTTLNERSCGNGVIVETPYACPAGCANGACVTCVDTDGNDYFNDGSVNGRVLGGFEIQTDQCINSWAIEKVCSNFGYLSTSNYECDGGCIGNSCKSTFCNVNVSGVEMCGMTAYNSSMGKKVCRISTGVLESEVNEDFAFGDALVPINKCALGCNTTTGTCITHGCYDVDAGITENYTKSFAGIYDESDTIIDDFCKGTEILSEAVCSANGKPAYSDRTCEFGCSNGKCDGEVICNDSTESGDGGLNYFINGTTVQCVQGVCNPVDAEYCADGSVVWESYCGRNNELIWQQQFCSAGCVNGACVVPAEKLLAVCVDPNDVEERPINPGVRVSQLIEGVTVRKYCDPITLNLTETKADDDITGCVNDYECMSNICIEGMCTSIRGTLEDQKVILTEQVGLLRQIRCYLRALLVPNETFDSCMADYEGV